MRWAGRKEAIYAKEEMTDEDGMRACQLEEEYAELGGWESESDASRILQGLGIGTEYHTSDMATLDARLKVKVLLAQALFGSPDLLMMDEPTNNLDIDAVNWLEDFLLDFPGTVIVVSHDRHFLNTICTHIVDIDYNKIKMYVGNYDFWYESSQLVQQLIKNQNKRNEEKIKELQDFISRFSANKSKSKQATARRKLLDKLTVEEMPASSRRYPWVGFSPDREVGKDILFVTDVSKTIDGVKVLDKVSFIVEHGDKIAFVGDNENAHTALFKILAGEMEPDEGTVKWGQTATFSYFPKDNTEYFQDCDDNLVQWLRQFSPDPQEQYLRGFLGRMLFSGDEVYKPVVKVLSGGEQGAVHALPDDAGAMRDIPIFTFINKMDREGPGCAPWDPFELCGRPEELEKELGIDTYAMNWPIGCGKEFQGVYDRQNRQIIHFTSNTNARAATATQIELDDPALAGLIGQAKKDQLIEDIELLDGASCDFDLDRVRHGKLSPVFFGSALTTFGVEPFLEEFLRMTTPPCPGRRERISSTPLMTISPPSSLRSRPT